MKSYTVEHRCKHIMSATPPLHRLQHVPLFIKVIREKAGDPETILDVGCGALRDTFRQHFGEKYKGLETPGYDVPKDYEGYAENLPFPDESFDIVTAWNLVEHLVNPFEGLTEMLRVARRAVILCTDSADVFRDGDPTHLYCWTTKVFHQFLSKSGFKAQTWVEKYILFGIVWK